MRLRTQDGCLKANGDPRRHVRTNSAQLLGGVVLAIASLAFWLTSAALGWVLGWIVLLLALANLAFGL